MTPVLIGPGSVRYSSVRASNSKWILLQGDHGFNVLYTLAGFAVRTLPAALSHSAQVVFDRRDSNLLLYVAGNAVMMYDVVASVRETLHTFSEYSMLSSTHAEGDLSETSDLALCGIKPDGTEEVFLFNASTGFVSKPYPQFEPFDGILAKGSHLLLSKESGIYDLIAGKRLTMANGHAVVTSHSLLWCNSNENPVTLPDFPNAAVRMELATGKQTGLKSFDWAYAFHISAGPDFVVVSAYDPKGVLPFQIWRVPFDGSSGALLHEWKSPYSVDYQPRATYSDGLILFNMWDGRESNVMGLKLAAVPEEPPRISRFEVHWTDGAKDIFERKAT